MSFVNTDTALWAGHVTAGALMRRV